MAGVLLLAAPAASLSVQIGGVDSETQYTASNGVLTFFDAFNGFNQPEHGVIDTSFQVPAFQGKLVMFEAMLDTTSFNPATDDVRNAVFIGTGAAAELTIWDFTVVGNTVTPTNLLLALDVNFIDVTQAFRSGGALGGPDGTILMGAFDAQTFGVTSALHVVGGSLNQTVGGVGTGAVMEILMSSLNPPMTKALRNGGYLALNFSNGVGTTAVSTTWNLTFVPEPRTALLLGAGLLGALAAIRRIAAR